MYDLLSIGDTTLDSYLMLSKIQGVCEKDDQKKVLLLQFPGKIPVELEDQSLGGNGANVAVGVKKLGFSAGLLSHVGKDIIGVQIKHHLAKYHLPKSLIITDKNKKSNFSIILNFGQDRTILSFHEKRNYEIKSLPETRWVYLTSLGEGCQRLSSDLLKTLQDKNIGLVFAPGSLQLKDGSSLARQLLARTNIIIMNKEEAQDYTNDKTRDIKKLLYNLQDLGPNVSVITDGKNGCWAADGAGIWFLDTLPVKVVESTGAGDAFASAFMGAIITKSDIPTALCWGIAQSTSVIGKVGPVAGLNTKEKLESIVLKNNLIKKVKQI